MARGFTHVTSHRDLAGHERVTEGNGPIGIPVSLVFETSLGNFEVELFEKEAPVSAANFLAYVDDGFFDGVIFHRVIPGFMIQGGGFEPGMKQKKVKAPIKNEAANGLKNSRGTLAMARTNDINSATAQFFVNLVDNDFLDHAGPCQLRLRRVRQGHRRHGRHRQDRQGGDHHPLRPPERAGRGRDDHQGVRGKM